MEKNLKKKKKIKHVGLSLKLIAQKYKPAA